ncbi:hypothetical protein COCNU_01G005470 [Cocos nucifera]|uniref:PPPDE domain-containing protein n=1 Tax=Cocos nucifera TaxID=13894 RepID=A0A8K0HUX0_COCNU|nr:hypothetical protein COCNU_01G005470 [Cocos nucifera]
MFIRVRSRKRKTGTVPVYLNVYDLTPINVYAYWLGLGVYHSGVQVHGVEYAYGAHEHATTGIFEGEPRQCPGFVFRKSILIGRTDLGPREVRALMEELATEYTGNTYNLISKNCNHFCNEACLRLTNKPIPRWVNRLARIGFLCNCVLPVQVAALPFPLFLLRRLLEAVEEVGAHRRHLRFPRLKGPIAGAGAGGDWYNLEKSKRVKAFRCGEYDECIERARASAVCSKKKPANAGKYVRREDAILHALELEKAYFSNRNQISSVMNHSMAKTNNCLVIGSKHMHTLSKQPGYIARKLSVLDENSAQELSKSVLSFEQPNNPMASDMRYMLKKRWRTPNDSEDDATEGIKRMRDLQEIGLGTVSKRKPNIKFHAKEFDELAFADNASLSESNTDNGFSGMCHINGSKDSCSSLKKKRSHVVLSSENLRKKNHHRPQTKVSKGSRIIIPSYCHWGGGFAGWSSLLEETRNKLGAKSTEKKGEFSAVNDNSPNSSSTSCEEVLFDDCEKTCNTVDGTYLQSEIKDSELSSMLEFIDDDCSDGLIDVPLLMEDNIGGGMLSKFSVM